MIKFLVAFSSRILSDFGFKLFWIPLLYKCNNSALSSSSNAITTESDCFLEI